MKPVVAALMLAGSMSLVSTGGAQETGKCVGRNRDVRRGVAASAFVAGNVALYKYFESAWWSGEPSDFHVRHDWDENHRDQDKFGHLVGGFHLTQVGASLMREACISPKKAIIWSAAYATLFQLQIEIWDGYQAIYGFSPPDMIFNAAGAGFAVARAFNETVAAFKPTMSYSPTWANRTREQHGNQPRYTVDYSGQTYWLSADLEALLPSGAAAVWPGILRLSVGHSITDYFPPPAINSVRAEHRILVTLDLDPAKLPGDHPMWNTMKRALSYYHFPAPALQLAPTRALIRWYR